MMSFTIHQMGRNPANSSQHNRLAGIYADRPSLDQPENHFAGYSSGHIDGCEIGIEVPTSFDRLVKSLISNSGATIRVALPARSGF